MPTVSPNMSLTIWSLLSDPYNHNQLAANWAAVDQHDHSTGKGVQVGTAGLANNAVTTAKIASGAVTATQIAAGTITDAQIATGTITGDRLVAGTLTDTQIATGTITGDRLVSGTLTLTQLAAGVARLQVITSSVSLTAADGQLIEATGAPMTATLPSPTAGRLIGVFTAGGVASGASPVTITASSGVIAGLHGSTASIVLGLNNASALLEADGTNWMVVSGQHDTGWVALTLPAGASVYHTTPAYRQVGNTVYVRGGFTTGGSGGNLSGGPIPSVEQQVAVMGGSIFETILVTTIAGLGATPFPAGTTFVFVSAVYWL